MKEEQLVRSAIALVQIGKKLDASRSRLKQLVEQGIPYESDEMKAALNECMLLDAQWKSIEKQHLSLKHSLYQI